MTCLPARHQEAKRLAGNKWRSKDSSACNRLGNDCTGDHSDDDADEETKAMTKQELEEHDKDKVELKVEATAHDDMDEMYERIYKK